MTEIEIIARILQGDKDLYELIVRRFNPTIYKIGRSYNYNHADTQDLMQECFIDAYRNLAQFENKSSFKTWITRIMLNRCYHKSQKRSSQNEVVAELDENAIPMFSTPNNDTDKVVKRKELALMIEEMLARVPLEYRMVFTLREINGMDTDETAAILDISRSNVKVRLSRAKTMLRREFEKSYSAAELYEFNLIYCDAMVNRVMPQIMENKL
ncbi:sigma-70 family RNA polymerase sigma factor [Sphingobacterium sp. N143]|uniref:sigma-70 family RNA polymerase sigma factor n=1 Tax=Sphingobacterium sp. N143 TaxID=2746727 RepID=UPI0025776256|nr:sigma-70 family RNA polymerase sigma factor [Sphingobacterium sp. N143]MDM1294191.1 sigma-70 family RNA polymerase sigma factor [Sphingobacterium sp. N143]